MVDAFVGAAANSALLTASARKTGQPCSPASAPRRRPSEGEFPGSGPRRSTLYRRRPGGEIHTIHEDRWGDKAVLAVIKEGGPLGKPSSVTPESLVTFQAVKTTTFLTLPFQSSPRLYPGHPFHHRLIENMLHLIAAKRTPSPWKS